MEADCLCQHWNSLLGGDEGTGAWKCCRKSNLLPGLPGEKVPPVVFPLQLDHLEKQTKGKSIKSAAPW